MKMRTDQLIKLLAQSQLSKPPFGIGVAVALIFVFSLLITAMVLGLRPEIAQMTPALPMLQKTLLLAGGMLLSVLWLKGASTPLPRRPPFYLLWIFGAVCTGLVGFEWLSQPAHGILNQFLKEYFPACLAAVAVYGLLGIIGLTWLMRQYAPVNPTTAAALIGLTAAAAGALGYSLHCPFDSPTFVVVAYGIPVVLLTIISRKVLPKFLKW